MRAARLLDQPCFRMTAHTAQFDIDDAARLQFDCSQSVPRIVDTLVEANCGLDLRLKFGMCVYVIPIQGLLHHEQAEFIESF